MTLTDVVASRQHGSPARRSLLDGDVEVDVDAGITVVRAPGGTGSAPADRPGRSGGDRRRSRLPPITEWAPVAWDRQGYDGPERRKRDRRAEHPAPDGVGYYTDEWAQALGCPSFVDWLARLAGARPPGL